MEDAGESGAEQVAFLAVEMRVRVQVGVQVTRERVLDETRLLDVLRAAVWQLDPVVEQVVRDPENELVEALAAWLHCLVARVLLSLAQSTVHDPVVGLCAIDLATELEHVGARHLSQSLNRGIKVNKQD